MPTKGIEEKARRQEKSLRFDKRDTEIFAYCLLERCRDRNVGIADLLVVVAVDVGSS